MYKFSQNIERDVFDNFVSQHRLNALLQSYNWGNVKESWEKYHVGLFKNEELVAASLILVRKLPFGFSFGYIPRGPIMDYSDSQIVKTFFESLKKFAKDNKLMFLKFDPKILLKSAKLKEYDGENYIESSKKIIDELKSLGIIHRGFTKKKSETFQPRYDATLYLTENLEEKFSSNTRKMCRRARNKNVIIKWGSKVDCGIFSELIEKTVERQQVALRDKKYFERLFAIYENNVDLAFATIDIGETRKKILEDIGKIDNDIERLKKGNAPKKISILEGNKNALIKSIDELDEAVDKKEEIIYISGVLSIGYGDTYEMLYAGFDERFSTYYPQYLLYSEMMQKAYKDGYNKACMGGVEGDFNDGLTRFKSNFSPNFEEYIGEFDIKTSILYTPFHILLSIRSILKNMIKKFK